MNLIYDKYRLVNRVLRPEVRAILDVGCRDAVLKGHLRGDVVYTGYDLFPGPGVDLVGDVECGLPFTDGAFDAAIALDLLEHTDNIWFVYDELLRVARRQIVVVLPNAYHWLCRVWYLRGKEMGKYVLPVEPIRDRHRWLLSYPAMRRFCLQRAVAKGWSVTEEIPLFGSRRTALIDWLLSRVSKNLGVWAAMFVIEKNEFQT